MARFVSRYMRILQFIDKLWSKVSLGRHIVQFIVGLNLTLIYAKCFFLTRLSALSFVTESTANTLMNTRIAEGNSGIGIPINSAWSVSTQLACSESPQRIG